MVAGGEEGGQVLEGVQLGRQGGTDILQLLLALGLWRRVFLAVYMLVMVAASLWIVGRAFAPGSMVQIQL